LFIIDKNFFMGSSIEGTALRVKIILADPGREREVAQPSHTGQPRLRPIEVSPIIEQMDAFARVFDLVTIPKTAVETGFELINGPAELPVSIFCPVPF
jgi:hypothetical protein